MTERQQSRYDVAAFIWPSYHPDPRARIFWPMGIGEWETVMTNGPKFEGHQQPRYPLWGYVNEADPYVMAMQIEAAVDHGVSVLSPRKTPSCLAFIDLRELAVGGRFCYLDGMTAPSKLLRNFRNTFECVAEILRYALTFL